MKLDQCTDGLTDLNNRVTTQDWYHDLSEQDSSDENHQIFDGRPRPRCAAPKRRLVVQPTGPRVPLGELEPWFAQLSEGTPRCVRASFRCQHGHHRSGSCRCTVPTLQAAWQHTIMVDSSFIVTCCRYVSTSSDITTLIMNRTCVLGPVSSHTGLLVYLTLLTRCMLAARAPFVCLARGAWVVSGLWRPLP